MPDSHATMAEEIARLRALNAELLAALRELWTIYGPPQTGMSDRTQAAWLAARAVIAKAEG